MRNPAAHVIQMLKPYKGECSNARATAADDASATIIDLKAGEDLIVETHGDFEHPTMIEEATGKNFQLPDKCEEALRRKSGIDDVKEHAA